MDVEKGFINFWGDEQPEQSNPQRSTQIDGSSNDTANSKIKYVIPDDSDKAVLLAEHPIDLLQRLEECLNHKKDTDLISSYKYFICHEKPSDQAKVPNRQKRKFAKLGLPLNVSTESKAVLANCVKRNGWEFTIDIGLAMQMVAESMHAKDEERSSGYREQSSALETSVIHAGHDVKAPTGLLARQSAKMVKEKSMAARRKATAGFRDQHTPSV